MSTDEFVEEYAKSILKLAILKGLEESYQKKFNKLFKTIWSNCVVIPKMHKLAYENNSEYRLFYNGLSPELKARAEKTRRIMQPLMFARKIDPANLIVSGIGSLFGNSPQKIVTSSDFTEALIVLNTVMSNNTTEVQ